MNRHLLRARIVGLSGSVALLLAALNPNAHGQDATWNGATNDWFDSNNWSPATVPTGTATFSNNGSTSVDTFNGVVILGGIVFTAVPNAQAYSIAVNNPFILNGTGVANNSTNTQTFEISDTNNLVFQNGSSANAGTGAVTYTNDNGGFIYFQNTSTAGTATTTITNNGVLQFNDTSTAGSAQIENNGTTGFFDSTSAGNATITNGNGASLTFNNTSTASTANITNQGGGLITFGNTATAATATIMNNANATLIFNDSSSADGSNITNAGTLDFNNSSTAKNSTIINNGSGAIVFDNTSTAAAANITNNKTSTLTFQGSSTAAGATITNNASVLFVAMATATNATTIMNNMGGVLDISGLTNGGVGIGQVTGAGNIVLGANTLTIGGQNVDATIGGTISGVGGSLTKTGTGVLTLSGGSSTYNGTTTVKSGTLLVTNTSGSATGSSQVVIAKGATLGGGGIIGGPITLQNGGTLKPGVASPGVPGTTLTGGPMTWNPGGTVTLQIGATADNLVLNGALTKGTVGSGAFKLDLIGVAGLGLGNYTIATFTSTNFKATQFSLQLSLPSGDTATLSETTTSLSVDITKATTTTGSIIQNSAPVNTPTNANFIVTGQTITGPGSGDNTINTLTFLPGGSLQIFQTLFVTQGPVDLVGGASITLSGNLAVSQLNVLPGGLLNGNGIIYGNLFNAGIVSPGDAPGRISVSGNYTQAPSGLLQIKIGGLGAADHDLLAVGGTATLGGTLQLVPVSGYKLQRNKPVTFLTAPGGVTGQFAAINDRFPNDTILVPTVLYGPNSVALEGVQGSFAQFAANSGLTPNQRAIAVALDSAANDRRANSIFAFLDYEPLKQLPRDLQKISPEELTSIFTISTSYAQQQSLNLQRRTDDIRSGSSGFNAANLALNGNNPSYSGGLDITTGVAGPNGNTLGVGDDGKEMKETKEVAPAENRWGTFLSGTGEWVNVSGTNEARGYQITSGGFTLGVDYKLTPNFAVGLAAGYTGTTSDLSDHGRVWVNGGKLGLYSTVFSGGWYADIAGFGGYNSYDTRRSALEGEARGSTHGGEVDALFGTGYDFRKGNLTFGPTASFNYTYAGVDGFDEHNSLAPLSIHGENADSLRTALGFKINYDWKVGGVLIKPELRAAWQHEFGDTTYSLDSSFANGAGGAFASNGPRLGRESALIGAGFAIQLSERCSTYLYYDGEIGRENYQSNSVTGGVRLTF